jgi:hypothetical protein
MQKGQEVAKKQNLAFYFCKNEKFSQKTLQK